MSKVSVIIDRHTTPNLTPHRAWAPLGAVRQPFRSFHRHETGRRRFMPHLPQSTVTTICSNGSTLTARPSFSICRYSQCPCRACHLFESYVKPLCNDTKNKSPKALWFCSCVLDHVYVNWFLYLKHKWCPIRSRHRPWLRKLTNIPKTLNNNNSTTKSRTRTDLAEGRGLDHYFRDSAYEKNKIYRQSQTRIAPMR